MKRPYIHDNFLLGNKYAEELYHGYVKDLPIIDYHCHLPPQSIAEDEVFDNITQPWIYGDHYKWRAMRTHGVDEKFITGKGTDREKFDAWAATVPYTLRNPLYHWTHLELSRYFGITELLTPDTADKIYEKSREMLQSTSCRSMVSSMNVEVLCTTDDPLSQLESHQRIAGSGFETCVRPSFRPDKAILIENVGFNNFMTRLSELTGVTIRKFSDVCEALKARMDYFSGLGCRISDHGLEYLHHSEYTEKEVDAILARKLENKPITDEEAEKYRCAVLQYLSSSYHERGWVQQFHLGALRNNNSRMDRLLGPDTGWDSIGDFPQAVKLSNFLNSLDAGGKLARTIIYNLNPADNALMATMVGNFNDGSVRGKVQFGSAWWFLDQKDGIIDQVNALSNMGLVSTFVGMLTDSRSFLSYPRHEYFRRVLCNLFGQEIESGELPEDTDWIGRILSDICYYNAKEYFKFH